GDVPHALPTARAAERISVHTDSTAPARAGGNPRDPHPGRHGRHDMSLTADTNQCRSRRRASRAAIAVAAVLTLVAAGCGDDDDTTSAGAGSGGQSDGEMTISVAEPADAAEVGTPFDVEVDTSVEVGEPDTGLHHVHLYYDGNTQEGDYDVVYEPTFT